MVRFEIPFSKAGVCVRIALTSSFGFFQIKYIDQILYNAIKS